MTTLRALVLLAFLAPAGAAQIAVPSGAIDSSLATTGDRRGDAVAVDGDVLVVGARAYSASAPTAGAATVYERAVDGAWLEVATLFPPTPTVTGFFGDAVAVDGDTVFVAETEDDLFGPDEGAVHVFRRDVGGGWSLLQSLGATVPADALGLGHELAADAGRLAVAGLGSPFGVPGAVYLFARQPDGSYALEDEIPRPPAPFGNEFATSVALAGDWLLIGAADLNVVMDPVAFVHRRQPDGTWPQVAELVPSPSTSGQRFGAGVAAIPAGDGLLAAVGAPGTGPTGDGAGAVYLFGVSAGGAWSQVDAVSPPFVEPFFDFGDELALTSGELFVAAPRFKEDGAADSGRLFVYRRDGPAAWSLARTVDNGLPGLFEDRFFGLDLALDAGAPGGRGLIVGEPGAGGPSATFGGTVHRFDSTTLLHGPPQVSVASGGAQDLYLSADADRAGAIYLVLGTTSGVLPGLAFTPQVVVPLNPDAYTDLTLAGGGGLLAAGVGTLDAQGSATAQFVLPALAAPALVGLAVHHAAVTLTPAGVIDAILGPAPAVLGP